MNNGWQAFSVCFDAFIVVAVQVVNERSLELFRGLEFFRVLHPVFDLPKGVLCHHRTGRQTGKKFIVETKGMC